MIFFEFNEANFDLISRYVEKYPKLSSFQRLLARGHVLTQSEISYELLEPWIQWVTVHTGMDHGEHGVFRLGDIVHFEGSQLHEVLVERGVSVGAISPMNMDLRSGEFDYFVPDPWTESKTDRSWFSRRFHKALRQTVTDNSEGKISLLSAFTIIYALCRYGQAKNFSVYIKLAVSALRKRWMRALFLDLLLHDVHYAMYQRFKPSLSILFLNGLAHIQHHYYFNSEFYDGEEQNPSWYVSPADDPVFDALAVYDRIMGQIFDVSDGRISVATGLRQVPFEYPKFYWRLKEHDKFLTEIGAQFSQVLPRMTRDFLIKYDTLDDQALTEELLQGISIDGISIFGVIESRNHETFCTLTYDGPVDEKSVWRIGDRVGCPRKDFVFVALKNGQHHSQGYYFPEDYRDFAGRESMPLKNIFQHIIGSVAAK